MREFRGKNKLVSPVVKWVGGKRRILDRIMKYIPQNVSTYYEPFLGGGAVLFELQPKKAVVNDVKTIFSEFLNTQVY
ncbi:MAG: DNA adenine methylase [Desulfitobacteriaceae bacterium]|nr:DNA adenine methylase [Desulfitobacteriaceae bacterium]MDI6915551.1 DNA adenine methylase [Desulfitobacteriaceae bacterium]